MSRRTIKIDTEKFADNITDIMNRMRLASWRDVSVSIGYSPNALGQAKRKGFVNPRMAMLLEEKYGLKREEYELVEEGIFAEQEEPEKPVEETEDKTRIIYLLEDIAQNSNLLVYEGIRNALDDVQIRNTLRGIIASGIVAALEAQKGAKA